MKFKFEGLKIWQRSMDMAEVIYDMVDSFPEKERYNLSSQFMRAADSIALNIAEGSIDQSNPEFKKFMGYAIRSLAEVVTCLHKANRRKYLTEEKFESFYQETFELMNMMTAFKKKINVGVILPTSDF